MSRLSEVVRVVGILAEAVRAAGEVPSGHLYMALQSVLPPLDEIGTYEAALRMAVGAKLVERRCDLLRWIGPAIPESAS